MIFIRVLQMSKSLWSLESWEGGQQKFRFQDFLFTKRTVFPKKPTSKWKCWEQQQPHNHKHNHSHNQLILSLLPALKLQQEFGANPIQSELGFAVLHGLFLESLLGGSSQDRRKWLISMIDKFDNFPIPGVISCPHGLCLACNLQSTY